MVSIAYNKRDAYFSMPELIAKRMTRRIIHYPCSVRRQSSCVWCCRLDHSRGRQHSRHGRKTTWYCTVCEVALCKVRRYNDLSCFELFHTSHELFDPCCVQAQQLNVSVRGHSNRHPLPPRHPAGGDDDPMQIRIRRFVLKIQVLHLLVTCCHLLLVQALLLIRIMTPCHIRMTKTTNQHSRWMPRCLKKAKMTSPVMTTMKEVNVRQFEGDYQLA